MQYISDYMNRDHRLCDEACTRAVQGAEARDWTRVAHEGGAFLREMERHIRIEEEILFPAFEERTGMVSGPTATMRLEHTSIRNLLGQMAAAIEARQAEQFLDRAASLVSLLETHNMKEEMMMYPMLDQALGDDARGMVADLQSAAT